VEEKQAEQLRMLVDRYNKEEKDQETKRNLDYIGRYTKVAEQYQNMAELAEKLERKNFKLNRE